MSEGITANDALAASRIRSARAPERPRKRLTARLHRHFTTSLVQFERPG